MTFAIDMNNNSNDNVYGRIATFTWPSMQVSTLDRIQKEHGLSITVPRTLYTTAVHRAVEVEASLYKSGSYRRFARKLKENVVELVQEVVVPDDNGQARGDRSTVARFIVTGGSLVIKPVADEGKAWLEGEGGAENLYRRIEIEMASVPAGLVGQWAEDVVLNDLGGLELGNRGHSFHVTSANAPRFDRFMEAMLTEAGDNAQVFVAKTVDNSPETLASLVRSARISAEKAIEKAMEDMGKVKTMRGINGIVDRLNSYKASLEKYNNLLGQENNAILETVNKAIDTVLAAEVTREYGGLAS